MSAGAIVALVLALVLVPFALSGPWWLEILPLVIGAASWWAIAEGRRRGRALAVIACVVAVLAGVGALLLLGAARSEMQTKFAEFLGQVSKGDPKELEGWVLEGEDPPTTVAKWRARMAAAEMDVGPYGQRVDVEWGLFGPYIGLVIPPRRDEVEEVGGTATDPWPRPGTIWFRSVFARDVLWTAVVWGKEQGDPDLEKVLKDKGRKKIPIVRDLRFFRPKTKV
jgi:hypothetical protein